MRRKLRKVRLERGLTQREVAEKIGIARNTYTNIELGNKNPSLEVALNLKKVLKYDKDDIFFIQKDTYRDKK